MRQHPGKGALLGQEIKGGISTLCESVPAPRWREPFVSVARIIPALPPPKGDCEDQVGYVIPELLLKLKCCMYSYFL